MSEEKKDHFISPISLDYNYTAGAATTRFLKKVSEGKIVGQKCPKCTAVYVPPRGSCPRCGVATEEEVELVDKGSVESFTIVHIPIPGNPIVPPYVCAMIRLEGANISFLHLIQEIDLKDIRIQHLKILNGLSLQVEMISIHQNTDLRAQNERYLHNCLCSKSNTC